jgi:hypothetical protein
MAVDEVEQASGILRNMAGRAREGWDKMRRMLDGKKLVWKGSTGKMVAVEKDRESVAGEKETLNLEEELMGGTVEIIREGVEKEVSRDEDRMSMSGREAMEDGRTWIFWTELIRRREMRNWKQRWETRRKGREEKTTQRAERLD